MVVRNYFRFLITFEQSLLHAHGERKLLIENRGFHFLDSRPVKPNAPVCLYVYRRWTSAIQSTGNLKVWNGGDRMADLCHSLIQSLLSYLSFTSQLTEWRSFIMFFLSVFLFSRLSGCLSVCLSVSLSVFLKRIYFLKDLHTILQFCISNRRGLNN